MKKMLKKQIGAVLGALTILVCAAPAQAASATVNVTVSFVHVPSLADLRKAKSEEAIALNSAQPFGLDIKGQPVLASMKHDHDNTKKKIEYDFE